MGCSCYIGCGTRSARLKWACFGATVALCIICNAIGNAYMEPCQDPVTMGMLSFDQCSRAGIVFGDSRALEHGCFRVRLT